MIRYLIILLTIAAFGKLTFGQSDDKLNLKDFQLYGQVKRLESISYKPTFKDDSLILREYTRGIGQNVIVKFNVSGNVITEKKWQKTSNFDRDTNIFNNYYDNENRLIRRVTNSTFERVYVFDAKGNLTEEKTIRDSVMLTSTSYVYNRKNVKTKEITVRYEPTKFIVEIKANSKAVTRFKYRNDLLVAETFKFNKMKTKDKYDYNSNDKLIQKVDVVFLLGIPMKTNFRFYKYDANGNLIEELLSKKKNEGFHSKTKYSYNSSNLLISEEFYMTSTLSPTNSDSLKYNLNGLLIEKIEYSYGKQSSSTKYYYDNKGNLISEKFETHTGYSRATRYKYDKWNNWILKEGYKEGELTSIVKRKIEYY